MVENRFTYRSNFTGLNNMKKTGLPIESYENEDEKIVYHYGKPGERFKNADESVKKFYEELENPSKKGFFSALVKTKTSRMLLITIIALMAMIFIISNFDKTSSASINGIPLQLSAFSFEDDVYVSLKMTSVESMQNEVPLTVQVLVKACTAEKQIVSSAELAGFYNGQETFLRTSFKDYDILYIEADIQVNDSMINMHCDVIKN